MSCRGDDEDGERVSMIRLLELSDDDANKDWAGDEAAQSLGSLGGTSRPRPRHCRENISAGTMDHPMGNIALPMISIALAWDIATSSAMLPTVPLPLRL